MSRDNKLTILLAGVGIGAVAGLLLARCSGADLRKAIQEQAQGATNYVRDQAGNLVERVSKVAETSHDTVVNQLAKGKEAARNLTKSAKDFINTAADATTKATSDILDKSNSLAAKAAEVANSRG